MPYTIETKTGTKGPFNEEQIKEFHNKGQLKAEHQVTDQSSGQRIAVGAIIQGQNAAAPAEEESVFMEDEAPAAAPAPSPAARGTGRTRRNSGSRSGTGRQTRRRQKTRDNDNHYAPPEADSGYDEDFSEGGDAGVVYKCFKPIDKAVLFMRVIAVASLLYFGLGLITVVFGDGPGLAKFIVLCFLAIPLLIGYKLMASAKNIREGMRQRRPNSLRKGAEELAFAIKVWGGLLLTMFIIFVGSFLFTFIYYSY